LEGFSTNEFNEFVKNIGTVKVFDGIDEEDMSVCYTFKKYKPWSPRDIRACKAKNEKLCRTFMGCVKEAIKGKVYFNVNTKVIKKL
jgi:hypothetical protein